MPPPRVQESPAHRDQAGAWPEFVVSLARSQARREGGRSGASHSRPPRAARTSSRRGATTLRARPSGMSTLRPTLRARSRTHGERRTHRGDGSHEARPSAEAFCGEERRPFLRWGQMRLCLRSPTKLWLQPGTILRTCVRRGYAGRLCLFLVVAVEVAVPSTRRLDPTRSFMRGLGSPDDVINVG